MTPLLLAGHLLALLLLPVLMVGLINRTRALWGGRRGPRLVQTLFDLARLLRKRPVYSDATTIVFRLGPLVALATALISGLFVPLLGPRTPLAFGFDFVVVAYLWGLGRMGLMLAALDTGSSFEGMGASREAAYAAMIEPALFLTLGTLATATGHTSFAEILRSEQHTPAGLLISCACVVALLIVLQVEASRVPVDDPSTHLELTMIHEVMVLDHSGPELAALQYAAALKMTICAALVAAMVNPVPAAAGLLAVAGANLLLTAAVAVVVGCVESLVARLQLKVIAQYVFVALAAGLVALLTTAWKQGAAG
jgi:formate hydrogenlyase subunit 4